MTITTKGTALITGASAGIGAEYAEQLARRGHDLILVARDAARLQANAQRLRAATGRSIEVLPADLTDRADLAHIVQRVEHDPSLTLLVNNAGIALAGTLLDADSASIERLIALNITAPTLLAAAAARAFKARGAGRIVNIGSVVALAPEIFESSYAGSKAYVLGLTQSLAAQLADSGVTVQAVLPGLTRTEILDRAGRSFDEFPAEHVMEVEDLVAAGLTGLDRGETITIPPLPDAADWDRFEAARQALAPNLSHRRPGVRYREAIAA